ncbi:hypothetical protein [uncultured Treponema sp.]|uniref:hypothetical protein n=1 Tax=uncultured Treponema sp. TaxID=162155 RepID=UPI0025DFEFA5|nr:hypothetical protein [uncultured Treponema sp.]
MKKIMAAIAATLLFGASVFAEGYICANDLEKASITEVKQEEDGFVLVASVEKAMEVKTVDPKAVGDDTFTQAISTKGSGNAAKRERLITFPVKAGETIKIIANNSGSGSRPLHLVNLDTNEEIAVFAVTSMKEGPAYVDSAKAAVAGTYAVFSTSGGMYIYKIEITK